MQVNYLDLLVNLATLIVVLIYTRETWKMQKAVTKQSDELVHQTRLSMMPAFVIDVVRANSSNTLSDLGYRLKLFNEGNGIALNVLVKNIKIPLVTEAKIDDELDDEMRDILHRQNIAFETIPFIKPKEFAIAEHVSKFGNEPSPFDLLIHLQKKYAEARIYQVNLEFNDIEGNKYIQTIEMGKSGINVGSVRLA